MLSSSSSSPKPLVESNPEPEQIWPESVWAERLRPLDIRLRALERDVAENDASLATRRAFECAFECDTKLEQFVSIFNTIVLDDYFKFGLIEEMRKQYVKEYREILKSCGQDMDTKLLTKPVHKQLFSTYKLAGFTQDEFLMYQKLRYQKSLSGSCSRLKDVTPELYTFSKNLPQITTNSNDLCAAVSRKIFELHTKSKLYSRALIPAELRLENFCVRVRDFLNCKLVSQSSPTKLAQ